MMSIDKNLIFDSIQGILRDFKVKRDQSIVSKQASELDKFLVQVLKNFYIQDVKKLQIIQNELAEMELEDLFINLRV